MVMQTLDNVTIPTNGMNLKRFSDIDLSKTKDSCYNLKIEILNFHRRIISTLKEFVKGADKKGIFIIGNVGIDDSKLFCMDCIYLKIYAESATLEVLINLKESLNYKILERKILLENYKIDMKYLRLYESFWKCALATELKNRDFKERSVLEGYLL